MAVNKFDNSMFDAGTIGTTANKLLQMDGSAKIPAVDGSLLTGIPPSFTKNASDPTLSTNPSGGVGSLWANTTSGNVYCCTDATAGENIWINIGAGSGDIRLLYQGENYAYQAGGQVGSTSYNDINKYSLTSDGNATDVGNLTRVMNNGAGTSSPTYGYHMGGYWPSAGTSDIEKTQFSSDGNSVQITGDLVGVRRAHSSATNKIYGYNAGGNGSASAIDKFLYSTEANSTNVGTLHTGVQDHSGHSSSTHGYCAGGNANPIQKWAFASDGTATDVGDLTYSSQGPLGSSSTDNGYACGGNGGTTNMNKFSFTSDGNATNVASIDQRATGSGGSSTTHGYGAGGDKGGQQTNIFKYSFTTDGNSTSVGNLAYAAVYPWGQLQY